MAMQTLIRRKDNHELRICKDNKGEIWIQASFGGDNIHSQIVEYLLCEDIEDGIFLLTGRTVGRMVSITEAARRHTQFPVNSRIRLQPCS